MKTSTTLAFLSLALCYLSTAHAVTIDWVTIGDPGNVDDNHDDGYGGVNYTYRMGKYEVTNSQYVEFLNAVASTDPKNLYSTEMASGWNDIGGITRHGSDGNYTYSARPNRGNRPVNYVSWYDTLRFANWLHNGQPSGFQNATTTEDGAYAMSLGSSVVRKPGATVFLTSEDEWYKAAYYKSGGRNAGYWDYPTQSNDVPRAELPAGTDLVRGSANYYAGRYVDPVYYTTEVGAYTSKPSDSAYGTFDQGGNVQEWNESLLEGIWRGVRGGPFKDGDSRYLNAGYQYYSYPAGGYRTVGFRVASAALPYSFGDWASDQGYDPNDVMPPAVIAGFSSIDSLSGIADFNWTTTPTTQLDLFFNQISSIESGAFNGLTNLTELYLNNNFLSSIESGAFSGLTSLERLSLDFNQLSSIEVGAFSGITSLTELRLTNNQILSIEADDFSGLTNLTELALSQNQIATIATNAFSDQSSLTSLDLDSNQLTAVDADDFSGLTNLNELRLNSNQVAMIATNAFSDQSNLTSLDLSGNPISSIGAGAFSGLSSLPSLDLRDGQISHLVADTFSGLSSLTELLLVGNPITTIEADAFNGLSSLPSLDLSGRQLSAIVAGTFNGLTNLTELLLNSNQVASIEVGDLGGLANLTNLQLADNQITSIEAGAFSGLSNLQTLNLRGNLITTIQASGVGGLTNLQTLDLLVNPITTIEANDLAGLTNLVELSLGFLLSPSGISTIEPGAFSDLASLTTLRLHPGLNMTELNLSQADFSSLDSFFVLAIGTGVTSVSLENAVLNQGSLAAVIDGIDNLTGITELDLSGIDFGAITDLAPLYVMDDLTDLWLADTTNLAAADLNVLLNNLATIEGTATEGILYMTHANYDAFNAAGGGLLATWHGESGHHVEFVLPGDFDGDGDVDGADFLAWQRDPSVGSLADWEANLGTVAPPSATSAEVPEPATWITLLLGMMAVNLRRNLPHRHATGTPSTGRYLSCDG